MKFSFGIITATGDLYLPDGSPRVDVTDAYLVKCLNSILDLGIPLEDFEIIIVGGNDPQLFWERHGEVKNNVVWVPFDETVKVGWITRKKNLITENSKFDNVVYLLDYYRFDEGWYEGFLAFGNDWDVCMCIKVSFEGVRFRDWIAWDDPDICFVSPPLRGPQYKPWKNYSEPGHRVVNVPYSYNKTEFLYISGGFWVAKKSHMEKYPLCEELFWLDAEDVEWSKRWLEKKNYVYKMNTNSVVHLLKEKRLSCAYSHDGKSMWPGTGSSFHRFAVKSGIPPWWIVDGWYKNVKLVS